jgi:hypothetical protein
VSPSLRGLEVDHQLECVRLFDRQICWFGALEDLVDMGRGASVHVGKACSVKHQTSGVDILPDRVYRRQPALGRQLDNPSSVVHERGISQHHECPGVLAAHRGERGLDLSEIARNA